MNKQFLKVGLVALLAGIYSSGASATQVTGTADAEIITPVVITPGAVLNFGAFVPDPAGDTVTMSANGANIRGITANGNLVGLLGTEATFTLSGAALAVNIAIADTAVELTNAGTFTLDFSPTAGGVTSGHTIDGTGIIYVGGTLLIPAGATAGTYNSIGAYTVTVNYQ